MNIVAELNALEVFFNEIICSWYTYNYRFGVYSKLNSEK